jgi:hypothetical protein
VIFVAIVVFEPPPKLEKALATAKVGEDNAPVVHEPKPKAKVLIKLRKGQRVNVLDRLDPQRPFIRVQFVSSKKNSPPGYIRRADLTDWNSEDLAYSWDLIGLSRPVEGVRPEDWIKFAEELIRFSRRFPKTSQSDQARLEAARIYVRIASERKNAGAVVDDWNGLLLKAEEALGEIGEAETDNVASLRQQVAELQQTIASPPPPPTPEISERERQLNQLFQRAVNFYVQGDHVDEVKKLLQEILRMDPQYKKAIALQDQLNKINNVFK